MELLLAVKIGCLVGLLLLTLFCGLVPAQVKWFQMHAATGKHRRILNFIGCFAAGVFLGACLMHMVADALEDIKEELEKRMQQVSRSQNVTGSANHSSGADDGKAELDYPFGELVISCGFFLVFLIESLVVHCCPSATHSHGAAASDKDPKDSAVSPSSFRALVLFVSLSFHSVFEGLAVGVQQDKTEVLQLCGAVLVHKAIVVFSLALKLVQSGTRARWRLVYLVLFALMSPAGIAVGIGVSLSGGDASSLARAVLEGVAAGTFLYVTFIEILPHELQSSEDSLAKFFFIGIGFTFLAVIAIWA